MSDTESKYIPPETKEKEPKITVDFFFSAHGSPEDLNLLPAALDNADIFMPENLGFTKELEILLNKISDGAEKPEPSDLMSNLIYNRRIPIIVPDIPSDNGLLDEIKHDYGPESFEIFLSERFDVAIKFQRKTINRVAKANRTREDFIANKIKNEIKTLTQKFPELRSKSEIKVLVFLGAVHTNIHQTLKSDLELPPKILGRSVITFSTRDEVIRRLSKNPEKLVTFEECARSLIEQVITYLLLQITKDSIKNISTSRKLVSKLSLDQIRAFSESMNILVKQESQTKSAEEQEKDFSNLITEGLKKIGIEMPKTEEDIDKLLNLQKNNHI